MAQHNAEQTDAVQSYSDAETNKSYLNVFKRRQPLAFSPNRQYALAVVAPLQKQDSCETVLADDGSSEAASPAHAYNRRGVQYDYNWTSSVRPRFDPFDNWLSSTTTPFEPFSFDVRDAVRKIQRERRLQEMRRMQEQQWGLTFKAHPIRRYKPIVQLCGRSKTRSQQLD
ncbi:siaz-interacting nuclear protein isoform X2 [Labeo rohita]|uniref:siaz-interacting nuclear protein isoform X2 n=1 Tax=Labeo rohita TaxID=84645 RepID=UPI0021E2888A|nr:siaz-interacting nuclear protein isoform X2 [Labeo rohita]